MVKTPQDEAELASLQAKQHQILSTGRPVSNHPVPQAGIPQPSPFRAHLNQPRPNFILRPNPPLNPSHPGPGSIGPSPGSIGPNPSYIQVKRHFFEFIFYLNGIIDSFYFSFA